MAGCLTLAIFRSADVGSVDLEDDAYADINVIASTLKLWFRELPDPLFTYNQFGAFMEAARLDNDRLRHIRLHEQINELPDANYAALKYFMAHLHKSVLPLVGFPPGTATDTLRSFANLRQGTRPGEDQPDVRIKLGHRLWSDALPSAARGRRSGGAVVARPHELPMSGGRDHLAEVRGDLCLVPPLYRLFATFLLPLFCPPFPLLSPSPFPTSSRRAPPASSHYTNRLFPTFSQRARNASASEGPQASKAREKAEGVMPINRPSPLPPTRKQRLRHKECPSSPQKSRSARSSRSR